ncbi:MAG: hypothetical protein QHJ34_11775 [bacterium]|jgi:hypothetical protein|nr:hypothetical protein [candidate division KSB1 bacterium]MDH7560893.1 hypothetical protein [bacterium]
MKRRPLRPSLGHRKHLGGALGLLTLALFFSCAGKEPSPTVAFCSFEFRGEHYRIRSVQAAGRDLSFNELISRRFVAVDYGQDGFIDEVTLGEVTVAQAQELYEVALETLASEGKLRLVTPRGKSYDDQDAKYHYEVRTLCPGAQECLNQFRIMRDRRAPNPEATVAIDRQADGTIDVVVKGPLPLEEVQSLYAQVLKRGIDKGRLVALEQRIVVR